MPFIFVRRYCAILLLVLLWISPLPAQIPPGYYDTAQGKTGLVLLSALHQIIHNHTPWPYSSTSTDTSDGLKDLDEDPNNTNNVICIYSRTSMAKTNFGLTTGWNREHLWCDSYGLDGVGPSYTDLHSLRAVNTNVKSSRGNKYFDISDNTYGSYKKPAHAEAPECSTDIDSWEPPPEVKGDIARALFYMRTRYRADTNNEPRLFLTDYVLDIQSTNANMGRLSTLLRWHQEDPVDDRERWRNDRVYTHWQHNRNPYVDHPEYVPLAFHPQLEIKTTTATNVLFTYPSAYTAAKLQYTTNLTTWTYTLAFPRRTNGMIETTFTNPPPASLILYRLSLP